MMVPLTQIFFAQPLEVAIRQFLLFTLKDGDWAVQLWAPRIYRYRVKLGKMDLPNFTSIFLI